ncbi:MAG TPA: glycoside hydrolase family 32 protein [Ktedonobacteraceae bacterium]|nr:glycoside hydrolase family 32 protein [Ktedonobacteraceae bacterium]
MNESIEAALVHGQTERKQVFQEKFAADTHRPRYHFLPAAAWMNDPNGLIYWGGSYHLFYQYVPNDAPWETKHWGHAISTDLVHWFDLPVALTPTPGGPDQDGCFSGCVVNHDGVPTLIYTGVRGDYQLPCVATSADGLLTWQKYPGNPVIAAPPPDLNLLAFRDHRVWKEGTIWYQLIGAGIRGVGGTALLYRSLNLIDWEYIHSLYIGDRKRTEPVWTGSMWECPDFFPLGDKSVLLVSVYDDSRFHEGAYAGCLHYAIAFVGAYTDHTFTPQNQGIIDYGGYFYAPQSLLAPTGRRLLWGWLWEGRSDEAQGVAGWAGVMSLPRVLALAADNTVCLEPVPELKQLRGVHLRVVDQPILPTSLMQCGAIQGDCLEILAELMPDEATELGIGVRCAPDGTEQTLIRYDRLQGRLLIDRQQSSLSENVQRDIRAGPLALAAGEPLLLHIFLDRSVIEVFANRRLCMSSRVYPSRTDSLGVGFFARGESASIKALDVWEMGSIF